MTRRDFVWTAAAATAVVSRSPLIVPVRLVTDTRARCTPQQRLRFSSSIWREAVRDFNGCGIQLQCSERTGEIRRSPGDRPVFVGVERGVVNVVVTDHIPLDWDQGRGLAGVTTLYENCHLCVIALAYAHRHQIPFLSVNTCVHELLHAILEDIFVSRPNWFQTDEREFRIDWYATRLWLFRDGAAIRESAQAYLRRLRSGAAAPTSGVYRPSLRHDLPVARETEAEAAPFD